MVSMVWPSAALDSTSRVKPNWPTLPLFRLRAGGQGVWQWLMPLASVALAALAGLALIRFAPLPNVSMMFLPAVLFCAVRYGMGAALFASVLSFLAYNFFFIEPRHTFSVAEPHELLALFVLLAVAILTSAIAGRARDEAGKAIARAKAARRLYHLARRLSEVADPLSVVEGAAIQVHADLQRPSVVLLAAEGSLSMAAAWPPADQLTDEDLAAADYAHLRGEPSGAGTDVLTDRPWLFLPLRTPNGPVGVIGIAQGLDVPPLDAEATTFFQTIAELTATALERARLAHEIREARTAAETERVRNTLLASISHDFRTPLASVLGAATSLIEYGAKLPEAARLDLLTQIKEEAQHLDGMVRNLLVITRLEAGGLELHQDWIDLRELLERAVAVAKRRGATQHFEVRAAAELPLIIADSNLLSQVLSNLVGNAVRYAGPQAQVTLEARAESDAVVVSITDDGPGIAPELLPRVFDKFVRLPTQGDAGESTGLGLAIAKGIVEAHSGTISAEPASSRGGTRMSMRLPPSGASR